MKTCCCRGCCLLSFKVHGNKALVLVVNQYLATPTMATECEAVPAEGGCQ